MMKRYPWPVLLFLSALACIEAWGPDAYLDPMISPNYDCDAHESRCDGVCYDTQNDDQRCGSCQQRCNAYERCIHGHCQSPCPAESTLCGEECVDLQSDREHCGACFKLCSPQELCYLRQCMSL